MTMEDADNKELGNFLFGYPTEVYTADKESYMQRLCRVFACAGFDMCGCQERKGVSPCHFVIRPFWWMKNEAQQDNLPIFECEELGLTLAWYNGRIYSNIPFTEEIMEILEEIAHCPLARYRGKKNYIKTIVVNNKEIKLGKVDYGECYYIEFLDDNNEIKTLSLGSHQMNYMEQIYALFDPRYDYLFEKNLYYELELPPPVGTELYNKYPHLGEEPLSEEEMKEYQGYLDIFREEEMKQ